MQLTDAQRRTIEEIAELCSEEDAPAVYTAIREVRSWFEGIEDIEKKPEVTVKRVNVTIFLGPETSVPLYEFPGKRKRVKADRYGGSEMLISFRRYGYTYKIRVHDRAKNGRCMVCGDKTSIQ
jgi:hypothetical protein